MGLFSKDIKSMDDLFLHTLQDIFYAEKQIVKSLPKLIEKATNRELASGLRNHLRETEGQVERLEQVFTKLGHTPRGVDCPAIDGLIKEADEVAGIDGVGQDQVRTRVHTATESPDRGGSKLLERLRFRAVAQGSS